MASTATHDDALPIPGYDSLDARAVNAQLRMRSQVELTRIDSYEQSHQDRRPVRDKLRYLRNDEPLDGYDQLDSDQVLAALDGADTARLAAVRGYEMKLRNRQDVLSGLVRLRDEHRTLRGAGAGSDPEVPAPAWAGVDVGGFRGAAMTTGVVGLMGIAAALLIVLLAIMVYIVVAAVAPGLLIG